MTFRYPVCTGSFSRFPTPPFRHSSSLFHHGRLPHFAADTQFCLFSTAVRFATFTRFLPHTYVCVYRGIRVAPHWDLRTLVCRPTPACTYIFTLLSTRNNVRQVPEFYGHIYVAIPGHVSVTCHFVRCISSPLLWTFAHMHHVYTTTDPHTTGFTPPHLNTHLPPPGRLPPPAHAWNSPHTATHTPGFLTHTVWFLHLTTIFGPVTTFTHARLPRFGPSRFTPHRTVHCLYMDHLRATPVHLVRLHAHIHYTHIVHTHLAVLVPILDTFTTFGYPTCGSSHGPLRTPHLPLRTPADTPPHAAGSAARWCLVAFISWLPAAFTMPRISGSLFTGRGLHGFRTPRTFTVVTHMLQQRSSYTRLRNSDTAYIGSHHRCRLHSFSRTHTCLHFILHILSGRFTASPLTRTFTPYSLHHRVRFRARAFSRLVCHCTRFIRGCLATHALLLRCTHFGCGHYTTFYAPHLYVHTPYYSHRRTHAAAAVCLTTSLVWTRRFTHTLCLHTGTYTRTHTAYTPRCCYTSHARTCARFYLPAARWFGTHCAHCLPATHHASAACAFTRTSIICYYHTSPHTFAHGSRTHAHDRSRIRRGIHYMT